MRQKPMIIALASIGLASCASTTYVAGPPKFLAAKKAQPSAKLTAPCKRTGKIPHKEMGAGETERFVGGIIVKLENCANRHDRLGEFYQKRDADLSKQPLPAPSDAPVAAPSESPAFRNPFAGLFGNASEE